MNEHAAQAPVWANYIPLVIVPVVLLLRARAMTRLRPLRIERLWIAPALYSLVVIALYAGNPPHGAGWAVCTLALAVGAALGWQRGKTVRLQIDPGTGTLQQRGSAAGLLFLVVLFVVKSGARSLGARFGFDVALATDALAMLALGLIAATRMEMYGRARRLLGSGAVAR